LPAQVVVERVAAAVDAAWRVVADEVVAAHVGAARRGVELDARSAQLAARCRRWSFAGPALKGVVEVDADGVIVDQGVVA
jgi:hypothetical protein